MIAETQEGARLRGQIDGAQVQFRLDREAADTLTVLLVMKAQS
jgi:hypothetical protein